jgi:hypothetical protein
VDEYLAFILKSSFVEDGNMNREDVIEVVQRHTKRAMAGDVV